MDIHLHYTTYVADLFLSLESDRMEVEKALDRRQEGELRVAYCNALLGGLSTTLWFVGFLEKSIVNSAVAQTVQCLGIGRSFFPLYFSALHLSTCQNRIFSFHFQHFCSQLSPGKTWTDC